MTSYSTAVAELSKNIGIVPKSEYERLAEAAEVTRNSSIEAKANLDRHTEEHGCDGNDGEATG